MTLAPDNQAKPARQAGARNMLNREPMNSEGSSFSRELSSAVPRKRELPAHSVSCLSLAFSSLNRSGSARDRSASSSSCSMVKAPEQTGLLSQLVLFNHQAWVVKHRLGLASDNDVEEALTDRN